MRGVAGGVWLVGDITEGLAAWLRQRGMGLHFEGWNALGQPLHSFRRGYVDSAGFFA